MPYRHAFRRYSASNDVHMVSLPLNESLAQWHEQEMDFTNYSQCPSSTAVSKAVEGDASCLRLNAGGLNALPENASLPPSRAYQTNDFTYSQLMDMESDVPSLDVSRTSSIAATSLSPSDSNTATAEFVRSPLQEKLCPLIAGEIESCQPSRCGPDAPCMNFANLPPIEECTSVPCIRPSEAEENTSFSMIRQPSHISTRRQSSRSSSLRQTMPIEKITSSPTTSQSKLRRGTQDRQRAPKESTKAQSRQEAKQRAKAAHSLVEKKYRENLNTKLILLHNTLQNAYYGPRQEQEADSEFEIDADFDPYSKSAKRDTKFRKSEVLSDAMNYVNQTEVEMRHMENEILRLSERVRTLEKLVSDENWKSIEECL